MGACVCGYTMSLNANRWTKQVDPESQQYPEFYILTGGPGVGKTSIMLGLEQLHGEHIVREAAMDVIRYHQARRIAEPWTLKDFQDQILKLQLAREGKAAQLEVKRVFIDRGIVDNVAYYEKANRPLSQNTVDALANLRYDNQYTKVFLVENFGECEGTVERREGLDESLDLERRQEDCYLRYGFSPIRIPPGKLEDRMQTILDHIERDR